MVKIKFRIDKGGEVHIDVIDAHGVECEALTRAFEEALGTKVDTQHKPEYFVELDNIEQKVYEN